MLNKRVFFAAMLAALLAFGACATGASKPVPEQSLYQRLGGRDAIDAVVVDAIGNISADARINRRFSANASAQLHGNLVELLCARSGGPCTYSGLDMSSAHEGMNIHDDEFEALVEDLIKSLDKFKVPAREKAEVLAALGKMKNAIVGH